MAEELQERRSGRNRSATWKRKEEDDRIKESKDAKKQKQARQENRQAAAELGAFSDAERESTPKSKSRKCGRATAGANKEKPRKLRGGKGAAPSRVGDDTLKGSADGSPMEDVRSPDDEDGDPELDEEEIEDCEREALPTEAQAKKEVEEVIAKSASVPSLQTLAAEKRCPLRVKAAIDPQDYRVILRDLNRANAITHAQLLKAGVKVSPMQKHCYVTRAGMQLVGDDEEVEHWGALSAEEVADIQSFCGNFPTVSATRANANTMQGEDGYVVTLIVMESLMLKKGTLWLNRSPCSVEGQRDYTVPPKSVFSAFEAALRTAVQRFAAKDLNVFTGISSTVGEVLRGFLKEACKSTEKFEDDVVLFKHGYSQARRMQSGVVVASFHAHACSILYKGNPVWTRLRLISSIGRLCQILGASRREPFSPKIANLRDLTTSDEFAYMAMDRSVTHDWQKYWWTTYYELMLVRTRGDEEAAIKLVKLKLGEGSHKSVSHCEEILCGLQHKVDSLTALARMARESSLPQLADAYDNWKNRAQKEEERGKRELKRHKKRLLQRQKSGSERMEESEAANNLYIAGRAVTVKRSKSKESACWVIRECCCSRRGEAQT